MEKLTLNSDLKNITIVEKFVEEISDAYELQHTHFGNILLVLTEAFKNAVIHGNANDPEKKVTIAFDPVQRGLSFTISDEGKGFDINSIPDPVTAETDENAQKGRGIYVMRSLSDDIKFKENGSCIEITFDVEGIGQKTMSHRKNLMHQYYKKNKEKV